MAAGPALDAGAISYTRDYLQYFAVEATKAKTAGELTEPMQLA